MKRDAWEQSIGSISPCWTTSVCRYSVRVVAPACVLILFSACSRTSVPNTRVRSLAAEASSAAPVSGAPKLPSCPPAGTPMLRANDRTGHHKILLSWNASAPSTKPENNAVGYCLYRSKKKHAARKNPLCRDCEQVNSVPLSGAGCVDDLVQDDVTYYYVVTAIDQHGSLSSASNEIVASIPSRNKAGRSFVSSPPRCRVAAASK